MDDRKRSVIVCEVHVSQQQATREGLVMEHWRGGNVTEKRRISKRKDMCEVSNTDVPGIADDDD